RLNADGTLDSEFQNGLSGIGGTKEAPGVVSSITVQSDGKVLIGGGFATINGVTRHSVARVNTDGSVDSSFQNGLSGTGSSYAYGYVFSVAVQSDGKVIIGGVFFFTTANGLTRNHLARLNDDGSLDSSFLSGQPGPDDEVNSVALQKDGKVLIGGQFRTVNGVSRGEIARLNADGTLDNGFLNGLSSANAYVSSVWLQRDGNVLIGGAFTTVNGAPALGIGRVWGEAVPPGLTIVRSADTAIISWPPSGASFGLQSTTNLTMPN